MEADPLSARCDEASKVFAVSGQDLGGEGGSEGHDDGVAGVRRPNAAEEQPGVMRAVFVEYAPRDSNPEPAD